MCLKTLFRRYLLMGDIREMGRYRKHKGRRCGKRITYEEMDKLSTEIESNLARFIKEGKYKDVLIKMGNLEHYSLKNQIYIIMQCPEAQTLHGLRGWNQLGRRVKTGEKAIRVFVPIVSKKERKEEDEEKALKGFRSGSVFDLSQTEGPAINAFRFDEAKIIEDKERILRGLRKTVEDMGYQVAYLSKEETGEECYGYCNHKDKQIRIQEGLSDLQEVSTLVHECGHALAHAMEREDFKGLTAREKKGIKEVEAESIACIVCTYLGLDTQNFNFSYITGWAEGDVSKFHKNLDVISKHAKTLIDGVNKEFEEGINVTEEMA